MFSSSSNDQNKSNQMEKRIATQTKLIAAQQNQIKSMHEVIKNLQKAYNDTDIVTCSQNKIIIAQQNITTGVKQQLEAFKLEGDKTENTIKGAKLLKQSFSLIKKSNDSITKASQKQDAVREIIMQSKDLASKGLAEVTEYENEVTTYTTKLAELSEQNDYISSTDLMGAEYREEKDFGDISE